MPRFRIKNHNAFVGSINDWYSLKFKGYNLKNPKKPTTKEDVIDLILDAFHSCAERDIYTGDQIELLIIEKSGV